MSNQLDKAKDMLKQAEEHYKKKLEYVDKLFKEKYDRKGYKRWEKKFKEYRKELEHLMLDLAIDPEVSPAEVMVITELLSLDALCFSATTSVAIIEDIENEYH